MYSLHKYYLTFNKALFFNTNDYKYGNFSNTIEEYNSHRILDLK